MKGNKGKEVTTEGDRHEVKPQVRPSTGFRKSPQSTKQENQAWLIPSSQV